MSQSQQYELQVKIAEIINRSRLGEEMFFIDFEKAAQNVLKYLAEENVLADNDQTIAIEYNHSKAA